MDEKQLEEAMAETIEKSFNDSELEDIMNEIESLEKEFTEDSGKLALNKARPNVLQDVIDREVQSVGLAPEISKEEEEIVNAAAEEASSAEVEELDRVLEQVEDEDEEIIAEAAQEESFEEPIEETIEDHGEESFDELEEMIEEKPSNNVQVLSSRVGHHPSSGMDIVVNFSINGNPVSLKVDQEGLCLSLKGVNLTIDGENGCTMTMDHGVKFSIPLADDDENLKKAS